MLKTGCFFSYVRKIVFSNDIVTELSKKDQEMLHRNFVRYLNLFPHFPDRKLITDLSRESYERKICVANLVFLPFQKDIDTSSISFLYANDKISFDDSNRRLIRKLSESLDNRHALVLGFAPQNDNYYVRGIVDISNVNVLFADYYFISISGYLNWSAKCKSFDLFDYCDGAFCEFEHNQGDKKEQIKKVVDSLQAFSNINIEGLEEVLGIIANQNHGTSFVIFDSDSEANNEAIRLCNAGRGFMPKNTLSYDELHDCISQFAKVDGGIILDKNLKCYAYGCIYDGKVDESFSGSLARGSRFNSTKLYVHNLNNEELVCMGVVFSDDGGVECVK